MAQDHAAFVRAFDGSLADAKGLLAVERATFNESPYNAQRVQAMLTDGPQRAWLAFGNSDVVGFVVAFTTNRLSGPCWELDLLAVHPHWRGRGLATRLIQAAAAGSPNDTSRARAVVATDNGASARAFIRAGFHPAPEACTLLIYRPEDAGLRPRPITPISVREPASPAEAVRWLKEFRAAQRPPPGSESQHGPKPEVILSDKTGERRPTLLLAEKDGRPAGYAELVEVQTLLYHGVWIESLVAPVRATREALAEQVLRRGIAAGWDEMGAMVLEQDWPLRNLLLAQGFRSLGEFRWLAAELPLRSPDTPLQTNRTERDRRGLDHV